MKEADERGLSAFSILSDGSGLLIEALTRKEAMKKKPYKQEKLPEKGA